MYYGFSEHGFVFSLPYGVVYLLFLNTYPVTIFSPKLRLKGFKRRGLQTRPSSPDCPRVQARARPEKLGHVVPTFPGNRHVNQEHPTVLDYI